MVTRVTHVDDIVLSVTLNTGTQTWTRIVDGALTSLARRGQQKFSMTDVCAESGVSRGTLYRYFASREEVLDAIETRLDSSMREHVTEAISADPALEHRVEVVFTAMSAHWSEFPALELLVQTEPGMVLERLGHHLASTVDFFLDCLHPALEQASAVRDGSVTERGLVELMVHSAVSVCLLAPASHTSRSALLQDTMAGIISDAPAVRRTLAG